MAQRREYKGYERWRQEEQDEYEPEGPGAPDYDSQDEGYEQWEESYTEGDDGSIEEAYLLDPDERLSEEDLLFIENAFSPHMYGSPVPKDGLEKPDVPGWEMQDDAATTDVYEAIDAGEIYTPPEDPPTLPSRSQSDVDMGIGFASSADDAPLDEEEVPARFATSDAEIADRVREALRLHASTTALPILVRVRDGVVTLRGRVEDLDDIAVVEDIVSDVEGVEEVRDQLTIG